MVVVAVWMWEDLFPRGIRPDLIRLMRRRGGRCSRRKQVGMEKNEKAREEEDRAGCRVATFSNKAPSGGTTCCARMAVVWGGWKNSFLWEKCISCINFGPKEEEDGCLIVRLVGGGGREEF